MRKPQNQTRREEAQQTDPAAEWAELMSEWEVASAAFRDALMDGEVSEGTQEKQEQARARLVTIKARMDALISESRERRQSLPDSLVVGTLLRNKSPSENE